VEQVNDHPLAGELAVLTNSEIPDALSLPSDLGFRDKQ
jgi:hypothetical protein